MLYEHRNTKGQLHCENGPALVYSGGGEEWRINGVFHRTDGPAMIKGEPKYRTGSIIAPMSGRDWFNMVNDVIEAWYIHGNYHREDGPAVKLYNGTKEWYINGKRHREDGPAVESENIEEWWFNGEKHRTNGPAVRVFIAKTEWYSEPDYLKYSRYRYCKPTSGNYYEEYWLNGKKIPELIVKTKSARN